MKRGWWRGWLERFGKASGKETEWKLVVDGRALARLRASEPQDMFWFSFEIVPLGEPADPRLMDDEFWAGDTWRVVGATSGREASPVIASIQGLDRERQRVQLRGVLR
jgi:hypothetical protein